MADSTPARLTPEMMEQLSAYTGVGLSPENVPDLIADMQFIIDALNSVHPDRLRPVEPLYVAPLQGGAA